MTRPTFIMVTTSALITLSGAANAQSTGIAACDDFLKKYEACVASKVPAAQRATFQGQLEQMRKAWSDAAKNPSIKPTLEDACKQSAEQVKMALSGFGCAL